MSVHDHLKAFHGLPVHSFHDQAENPPEPESCAWRVAAGTDESPDEWQAEFTRLLDTVDTTRVHALVVGPWGESYEFDSSPVVEALLAARERLPALRAVFLGDITAEESEISWIPQTDVTPLLAAFPELAEFSVRGGSYLEFPAVRHTGLRRLTMQAGGLPAEVVQGVGASDLPALEHLELWLGTPEYGGDTEVGDLEPILSGTRLPRLRGLALRNSKMQDAVAAVVASAPVVDRLETLDLSLGTLTDVGAAALLSGRRLTHLKKLDLHHHYISEPLLDRIRQALEPAGVELALDRGEAYRHQAGDDAMRRYVAVSE
ncbi:STM4015 family protein [Streptomyces bungoensis]|uniref:STM4015 family protein n=1 Tax=Streptomyces bungoensis TaxID=285568 RepID=UPI00343B6DE2